MSELTFKGSLPPSAEFRRALNEAIAMTNPIDDLLELADRLRGFEQQHNISSTDFYRQYQAGTLGDELQHHVEWVAIYDLFVKTKRVIEATLMRAAIQPGMTEIAA